MKTATYLLAVAAFLAAPSLSATQSIVSGIQASAAELSPEVQLYVGRGDELADRLRYDAAAREYVKINSKEIEERLKDGPELVSAKFVIPYPPGFPIMVPGQVITQETITFMRKLDVKEIHGYNASLGLELLSPKALAALKPAAKKERER